MPSSVHFKTLLLQDALDFAILMEEEAAERYEELARQLELHHTGDAAEFFRQMVGNEKKHGRELTERRRKLFGEARPAVDRSMLWEVEAPEYGSVEMFMTAGQALRVALDSEKKAYQFFADALEYVEDPEVRTLFAELRDEELVHRDMVLEQLAKLPDDDATDKDAFADDPVAH